MNSLEQRLQNVIRHKETAQRTLLQLQGRHSAAKEDQAQIEKECRDRGVDPDKLDDTIRKLEIRLESTLALSEAELLDIQTKLSQYQE